MNQYTCVPISTPPRSWSAPTSSKRWLTTISHRSCWISTFFKHNAQKKKFFTRFWRLHSSFERPIAIYKIIWVNILIFLFFAFCFYQKWWNGDFGKEIKEDEENLDDKSELWSTEKIEFHPEGEEKNDNDNAEIEPKKSNPTITTIEKQNDKFWRL